MKLKLDGGGKNIQRTVLQTKGVRLSGLGWGFGNCGGLISRVERENFP